MNVFIIVNHIFKLLMYLFYYYTLKYTNSQIKNDSYLSQARTIKLWKIIKIKNL